MRSANELLMLADMLASISSLTLNGNVPLRKHTKTRMSLEFSSMRCEFAGVGTMLAVEEGRPGSRGRLVAWKRLYLASARELSE